MRIAYPPALAVLAVALVGCGSTKTETSTTVKVVGPSGGTKTVTTPVIPEAAISTSPETARVPEGAGHGAARLHSQFVEPGSQRPKSLGLTGSAIRLDYHGARLIEDFEEVQKSVYCPYWDAYGRVWTRGFGETDWGGNFGGRCISHAQAEHNLVYFVDAKYMPAVRSLGINLNQCQVNAAASLVWNLGPGVLLPGGSLRSAFQTHRFSAILGYDHAGGVVLAGLARRRRAEYAELTRSCPYGETPAQRRARVHRERVARLHRDKARLVVLNRAIAGNRCLNPAGYKGYSKQHAHNCLVWRRQHGRLARDVRALNRIGVR